jgi:hypothetical protein
MKQHAIQLQGMVAVAEARMNGDNSPEIIVAWKKQVEIGQELMKGESSCAAVEALLNFYIMQNRRETGEYHITAEVASDIGIRAIEGARKFINELDKMVATQEVLSSKTPTVNDQAERAIKQRATAFGKGLAKHGVKLSHCQILGVIASAEGHGSYQSLKTRLKPFVPAFCPHCGATGTLENVGSVFCEQGKWDGNHYEAEGDGVQFSCTRCSGQFTDWSGIPAQETTAKAYAGLVQSELDPAGLHCPACAREFDHFDGANEVLGGPCPSDDCPSN